MAEFFLEVPSEQRDFRVCRDPVLNSSYTEMHHQELCSVWVVFNP